MTGHAFIRPGQVAPEWPAPDHCMRCGQPEAAHATACPACERCAAGGEGHSAAELARCHGSAEPAEVIAGRAILADFRRARHEYSTDPSARPDWLLWSLRLSQHLQQVCDADSRPPQPAEATGSHPAACETHLVIDCDDCGPDGEDR